MKRKNLDPKSIKRGKRELNLALDAFREGKLKEVNSIVASIDPTVLDFLRKEAPYSNELSGVIQEVSG